jgi:streptomycin 6-kinase
MAFGSLELPPSFLRKNDADAAWLAELPNLLERLAKRWTLSVARHFPDIGHNYVAPATRADNTACVLKVSRHVDDTRNEIAALQLWDGNGAARLLDADPELGGSAAWTLRLASR